MNNTPVTVNVRMDARTFKRFALFDTFTLKRRWVSPAIFCAIFVAFSIVCFALADKAQSVLIGTLLLIIGLGLPGAYFLSYSLQVGAQAKRLGLKTPQYAYFVTLTDEEVRVVNNMRKEHPLSLSWDSLYGVWRGKDATYLYAAPARAFILPDGQASVSASALWDYLGAHLPADKLHGKRP